MKKSHACWWSKNVAIIFFHSKLYLHYINKQKRDLLISFKGLRILDEEIFLLFDGQLRKKGKTI
jgi:hypothetical protein